MGSHPQNPEFRINPENFHPRSCIISAIGCLIFLVIYFFVLSFATVPVLLIEYKMCSP